MRRIKQKLNKKLMLWKTSKSSIICLKQALFILLASYFLSGCGAKPWTDSLKGTEADSATQIIDSLVAQDSACGGTLEGDVALFYQNPLGKKALNGFLRFSKPSAYKFVMTNPLGQPILIIAGDQETFQAINTLEKKYLAGSLSSFGLRNDIPSYLLKSNWSSLITGRNQLSSQAITDIRNDRDSRGVWLTFQSKEQKGVYHLLLDLKQEIFRTLILENGYGKTVAEITYDNWVTLGECRQPLAINIGGLDYGTNIEITLSNVLLSSEVTAYRLKPPRNYLRQYLR
jgi:hypothetical protein